MTTSVRWLLATALALSLFFCFYGLGQAEFVGEDEALVMIKVARQFLWRVDVRNLGALLTSAHPPMRLIVSTPFVGLFGFSEFWLRFPHAFAGVLVSYWAYRVGRCAFSPQAGALAALLTAVSAMSGVYRSANGIGVFTLFLLIALEQLLRYLAADDECTEARALTWLSLFLGLATLTFVEGAVFTLPVAFLVWRKHRRFAAIIWRPSLLYAGFAAVYAGGWLVLPRVLAPAAGVAGNTAHLLDRLQHLGAFNLADFVNTMVGSNSLALALLFLFAIPWGLPVWGQGGWTILLYFTPHLLAWLFVIELPNGHTAYAMPAWALLTAAGLVHLYTQVLRSSLQRGLLAGVVGVVLLLAAWHTYVVFLQDRLARTPDNGVYLPAASLPAGAPVFTHWGQAAAGVYIREHGSPDSLIMSDFGGSLELYYAGRPSNPKGLEEVLDMLSAPSALRQANIRYLVLRIEANKPLPARLPERPACVVTVGGRPTLAIYDLWYTPSISEACSTDALAPRFYRRYATAANLRPFVIRGDNNPP